jgi:hypothetical protein
MRGVILPIPQYVFVAWCLVKDRDNLMIWKNSSNSAADKTKSYEVCKIAQKAFGVSVEGNFTLYFIQTMDNTL